MANYDGHQPIKGGRYAGSNKAVQPFSVYRRPTKRNGFRSYVTPIAVSLRTTDIARSEESIEKLRLINSNAETMLANIRDMSNIYEFYAAKGDYARIEGLISEVASSREEFRLCIKHKSVVSDAVIQIIPQVKKDLNDLERRIKKTLREINSK